MSELNPKQSPVCSRGELSFAGIAVGSPIIPLRAYCALASVWVTSVKRNKRGSQRPVPLGGNRIYYAP